MQKQKKSVPQSRALVYGLLVVLVLAAGGFFMVRSRHKNNSQTVISSTPKPNASNQTATTTPTPSPNPKQDRQSGPAGELVAPSGTFVSNHRPNISGRPTPNTESSICITTPNVQCDISFVSATMTKSLGVKTTDASGVASWSWSIDSVGLTAGTWTITAKASSGDKALETNDTLSLEVSP